MTIPDTNGCVRPAAWAGRLLGLYSFAMGFAGSAGIPFEGHDEPRVAGIARAMAVLGDVVVPRHNGEPFFEIPRLGHVPAALFGTATVLLTAAAVHTRGWRFGIAGGTLTQTTEGFLGLAGSLVVDPQLAFTTTLACVGDVLGSRQASRLWSATLWLGMAGGFLTKGPIGVAIPAAAAGGFLSTPQIGRWKDLTSVKIWRDVGWLLGAGRPPRALQVVRRWGGPSARA